MKKYGALAVIATELVGCGHRDPARAWQEAARLVFPQSPSSQIKGCPRGAYLGLCGAGLVEGIPAGSYTESLDNRRYALRAVDLLVSEPGLADADAKALWARVMNGEEKSHNSQMDVVLALWRRRLIVRSAGLI